MAYDLHLCTWTRCELGVGTNLLPEALSLDKDVQLHVRVMYTVWLGAACLQADSF